MLISDYHKNIGMVNKYIPPPIEMTRFNRKLVIAPKVETIEQS